MINPKRITQLSVMQQRNVSHSTVGIVGSGYAKPGRRVSILKALQVTVNAAHKLCYYHNFLQFHCQRSTQTLLISHFFTNEQ